MVKKLTNKQQRFVDEYLLDLNATAAAKRAGYSKKTASQIGEENLRKLEISKLIKEAIDARSERTKIDADWLLKRLADEVTANVADIYNDNGSLKAVHEWPEIWRTGLVAGLDIVQEYETVDGEKKLVGRVSKIKLSDRIKRLELIGKHVDVQAFRERYEHTVEGGVLVAPANMTPEQWIQEQEKANSKRTSGGQSGEAGEAGED